MNRCRCATVVLLAAALMAPALRAQTVRGVVLEDSTQRPIEEAVVTLIDADGRELLPGVRSATAGAFTLHAPRFGTYRVKAVRLGYQQVLSERLAIGRGEVVTVKLIMTVVATRVAAVRVTERRQYSPRELSSTVGFELRRASAVGKFLTAEDLDKLANFSQLGRSAISGSLTLSGNITNETLRFERSTGSYCYPQLVLDGQPLIGKAWGGMGVPNAAELNNEMAARALMHVNAIGVGNLYGVEIYRGDGPGPRLTGFLEGNECGLIAVWTDMQLARDSISGVVGPPRVAATGIQVIRGTVVNVDGEAPVAGVAVSVRSPAGEQLDEPVHSDSTGEFVIRTKRAGQVRLELDGTPATRPTTTPIFRIAPEELVVVRLFVSGKRPVSAPMGIAVRALPEDYGATDLGGFSYRRERGLAGQFLGPDEIRRRGNEPLGSLLGSLDGTIVSGVSPADTILMRDPSRASMQACRPAYMIDGARVANGIADSTVRALSLSRIVGIEVYRGPSEAPPVYADAATDCGLIGIWTRGE